LWFVEAPLEVVSDRGYDLTPPSGFVFCGRCCMLMN
jgi:hypothetical protein